MSNALAIAHKFERFVSMHGDDPFISKTISKMVATRLNQVQKELKAVQISLSRFERVYVKSSDQFFNEYQAGTAGDEMDFIEWASMIKMRERLLAEQTALQG